MLKYKYTRERICCCKKAEEDDADDEPVWMTASSADGRRNGNNVEAGWLTVGSAECGDAEDGRRSEEEKKAKSLVERIEGFLRLKDSFDIYSPRSRALRFFASYIIFLGILAFEIAGLGNRNMETYGCYLSLVEMMILLYVIGYAKTLWKMIRAIGVKLFFNDIWNGYDFVNMLLFILSFVVWGLGFEIIVRRKYDIPFDFSLLNAPCDNPTAGKASDDTHHGHIRLSRHQWSQNEEFMQYSEIFFLCATIMSFLRILQICQIHHVLGPIQLILLRTFKDVSYMMVVFMVFVLCFSLGIQMLYSNYREIDWQVTSRTEVGL